MRNSSEHTRVRGGRAGKRVSAHPDLRVHSLSPAATRGWVTLGWLTLPCALGRSGRRSRKREGDGATPVGDLRLSRVYYRADRTNRPRTSLAVSALRPTDGWCDAISDRNYNRRVQHPYPASAEVLWREDGLYDLVIATNHNARPRIQGHGSAIFVHVAQNSYSSTAGCIAFQQRHLLRLLRHIHPRTRLRIDP